MTTDPKDHRRLNHIIEAADHIAEFIGDVSEEAFLADYEKQSAVIRQLEVIGEAASKLSVGFVQQHTNTDWSKVIGMRHKMIHDYFEVDVTIVWNTVIEDVPALRVAVAKILDL